MLGQRWKPSPVFIFWKYFLIYLKIIAHWFWTDLFHFWSLNYDDFVAFAETFFFHCQRCRFQIPPSLLELGHFWFRVENVTIQDCRRKYHPLIFLIYLMLIVNINHLLLICIQNVQLLINYTIFSKQRLANWKLLRRNKPLSPI